MVGRQHVEIVALLDAALGTEAVDLLHAALDQGPIAGLDLGRAVAERAILRAGGVLGTALCFGLDVVAWVGEGEARDGRDGEDAGVDHFVVL